MSEHLHIDDYPATLRLLKTLVGHREDAARRLGYQADEWGVEVDWEILTSTDAPVSSTQRAALLIANGCAILERHGGLPPHLKDAVQSAVETVS